MRYIILILFSFSCLFLQADPLEIAESYRDLIWFVDSDNIMGNYTATGDPQQGYTSEEPCDWIDQMGENTIGMPYQYGGRDNFEEWEAFYVNGFYGPGGHSVHYPGSLSWAAGIDCSGFVGRCWEIEEYTLLMYFNTTYIANNHEEVSIDDLQPGDCFVKAGIHARLFYEWGEDNNVITIEATSGSYNRVIQYEYDLFQDIINQGYVLRRNVPLSIENCILNIEDCGLSNYPNPFNPSTEIRFQISDVREIANAELIIYNLKGQKVRTFLINSSAALPINSITWKGDDEIGNPVASGIYLYRFKAEDVDVSRKMLLLK